MSIRDVVCNGGRLDAVQIAGGPAGFVDWAAAALPPSGRVRDRLEPSYRELAKQSWDPGERMVALIEATLHRKSVGEPA